MNNYNTFFKEVQIRLEAKLFFTGQGVAILMSVPADTKSYPV